MNKHYRYCFECDKWLTKQEINEVDWGTQPGGKDGKGWYCKHCRKDTGDQLQIFKCDKHEDIILKVWGTCEGQNKEKIFYQECPTCKQEQGQPNQPGKQPNKGDSGMIAIRIIFMIIVVGALGWIIYELLKKDKRKGREPWEV